MDRPDLEMQEEKTEQETPITLDIQDGFIGGNSAFNEGER